LTDNEVSLRHYVETLFREYQAAHGREHALISQGVELARQNLEYRLAGLNEWRAQLQDERVTLVARDLFDSTVESDRGRIADLEKQVANMRGRSAQTTLALGIGFTILQIALRFLKL
jgi:predicted RNA binding protein with dsRBD fold (UPF0201 family)